VVWAARSRSSGVGDTQPGGLLTPLLRSGGLAAVPAVVHDRVHENVDSTGTRNDTVAWTRGRSVMMR
jgi:hypothetical protein